MSDYTVPASMEFIEEVEPGVAKVLSIKTKQIQYRYLPGNPQGKKQWALARTPPALAKRHAELKDPLVAQEFNNAGREARRVKKAEAIVRMAKEKGLAVNTPIEVYAEAAAMLTMEIFNDENSLRDRLEAYKKIGGDTGMVENLRDSEQAGAPTVAIQINVSPEMAEKYIDAEVIDVE